mmetsp:Transcript_27170/g.50078  ORF Transcript_27170/g.50078 Transcript_27170/m.50078 type:complete len:203 (-) Transcript_27170:234-842(-)
MKEAVIAMATTKADTPKKETPPSTSTTPSVSNLSAIIQNHNPPERLSRDGLNRGRTSKTKLGDMANPAASLAKPQPVAVVPNRNLDVEQPPKPLPVAILTNDVIEKIEGTLTNARTAGMKTQEAFQRALLSARFANDANAKIFAGAVPQSSTGATTSSSLSQILQGQNKPTYSQQKAFASTSRRTSLFPDKTESHLSRLLGK